MTRLSRYLTVKHPGDIKAISSKIPELKGMSAGLIQAMYEAFCDDTFSSQWVPVSIDDYPLDAFKEWLDQDVSVNQFVNAPRLEA